MIRSTVLLLALAVSAVAQQQNALPPKPGAELVDHVGSTGFIQVRAESFRSLQPRQQILAYWLPQASIAVDPIIYHQNSPSRSVTR